MVQTRGSRLVCFYCGKRSSLKYDGRMREFSCASCDATNHLDKFGDITDPPVAKTTSQSSRPTQYAISRASSPIADDVSFSWSTPPVSDTFCAQCLKNQALFTACLAQWESDDSEEDDVKASSFGSAAGLVRRRPDALKAQRRYYTFRKNLEKRYPQMCSDCEPRVVVRLRQAGYVAKTDHLRRMMERSRATRAASTSRRSLLNWADSTGWYLWWGGFAMQMGWHMACIALAVENESIEDLRWTRAAYWASWVSMVLPADRLGSLAVWSAVFACWWNPEWVKVFRGFSKHIRNLPGWYTLQAALIVLRVLAWRLLGNMEHDVETLGGEKPQLTGVVVITGHLVLVFVTSLGYLVALRAVTIDTTPLFGKDTKPMPQAQKTIGGSSATRRNQTQTLSDVLDEVLATPARRPPLGAAPSHGSALARPAAAHNYGLATTQPTHRVEDSPTSGLGGLSISGGASSSRVGGLSHSVSGSDLRRSPRLGGLSLSGGDVPRLGGLSLSGGGSSHTSGPLRGLARPQNPSLSNGSSHFSTPSFVPSTPQVNTRRGKEAEEMEWSPIPGPARALHSSSAFQQRQPFGAAPTQENHGAFWFKLPPAPVAPLTRAFKPTTAPIIVDTAPERKALGFGRVDAGVQAAAAAKTEQDNGVTFQEASFFAPEQANDPANKLADLLGSSWTLGAAPDDPGEATEENTDVEEPSGPRADVVVRELVGQVIPTKWHASVAQAMGLGLMALVWYQAMDEREVLMMGASLMGAAAIATWDGSLKTWTHMTRRKDVALSAKAKMRGETRAGAAHNWLLYGFLALHVAEVGLAIQIGTQVQHGDGYEELGLGLFGFMALMRLVEAVVGPVG